MRVLILAVVLLVPGFAAGPAALVEPAAKPTKVAKAANPGQSATATQPARSSKGKKARSLFTRGAFALGKVIMPDTGY